MAQAHRVAELAFMGFLFFLLRNVMSAISVAQACRVTELAFHDIFKGADHGISILPPQECHECYFSGSGAQSR